ncbi:beta-glucan-binding protein, partial [Trifolium medium]|nr:beta-glucan-binding protein [Trifolium medium]
MIPVQNILFTLTMVELGFFLLPESNPRNEAVLDKFSSSYAVSGVAMFRESDFKYQSIDGDLVGVVGDSWLLKIDPVSITWHSRKGVKEESHDEIVSELIKDVEDLNSSEITSSYFYGKFIARAA